jgi:c-di-GMP-related signal transduction protein
MAFNPNHLLKRSLVLDREQNVAFVRLTMAEAAPEALMPVMLKLSNLQTPQATYLIPLVWLDDTALLDKLPQNTILLTLPSGLELPLCNEARAKRFRIAVEHAADADISNIAADFHIVPDGTAIPPAPNLILSGVHHSARFQQALAEGHGYFEGRSYLEPLASVAPAINPSHAAVLELIGAVRQDAEPRQLEAIFKRDVTLTFKLLRYINSAFFGLSNRVESIRHALAIMGGQQLAKWLTLLAATAGDGASPALTQNAMMRARMMELMGARFEKHEQDNLFITGMFSLLDRIMQMPLDQLLTRANLPEGVTHALLTNEGRYAQWLSLAKVCEGEIAPEDATQFELDPKTANLAQIDAIEWALQIARHTEN